MLQQVSLQQRKTSKEKNTSSWKFSDFIFSVYLSNLDILSLLLDHGAEIDARDSLGFTALQIAVMWKKRDAAIMLIERGSNVNVVTPTTRASIGNLCKTSMPNILRCIEPKSRIWMQCDSNLLSLQFVNLKTKIVRNQFLSCQLIKLLDYAFGHLSLPLVDFAAPNKFTFDVDLLQLLVHLHHCFVVHCAIGFHIGEAQMIDQSFRLITGQSFIQERRRFLDHHRQVLPFYEKYSINECNHLKYLLLTDIMSSYFKNRIFGSFLRFQVSRTCSQNGAKHTMKK